MALPSANTVIGGSMKDESEKLEEKPINTNIRTFKRTFQHYATNNNASSSPAVAPAVTPGGRNVFIYGQGWYFIPYTYLVTAMTSADQDVIALSRNYRIVSQGFSITKINCIQQQVNANTSSTTISNSFVQAPCVMLFKDDNNEMFENTFAAQSTISARDIPIWVNTNGIDGGGTNSVSAASLMKFTKSFAGFTTLSDGASGTLREVQFQVPSLAGATSGAIDAFDLMNGGNITLLQSGQEFHHMWHNPIKQWLSPIVDSTATDQGRYVTTPLLPVSSVTMHNNAATELPRNVVHVPPMFLLRIPPLADSLGNIIIAVELWIEYTLTIEYLDGRYNYSRAMGNGTVGMLPLITTVNPYMTSFRNTDAFPFQVDPERNKAVKESPFKRPRLQ